MRLHDIVSITVGKRQDVDKHYFTATDSPGRELSAEFAGSAERDEYVTNILRHLRFDQIEATREELWKMHDRRRLTIWVNPPERTPPVKEEIRRYSISSQPQEDVEVHRYSIGRHFEVTEHNLRRPDPVMYREDTQSEYIPDPNRLQREDIRPENVPRFFPKPLPEPTPQHVVKCRPMPIPTCTEVATCDRGDRNEITQCTQCFVNSAKYRNTLQKLAPTQEQKMKIRSAKRGLKFTCGDCGLPVMDECKTRIIGNAHRAAPCPMVNHRWAHNSCGNVCDFTKSQFIRGFSSNTERRRPIKHIHLYLDPDLGVNGPNSTEYVLRGIRPSPASTHSAWYEERKHNSYPAPGINTVYGQCLDFRNDDESCPKVFHVRNSHLHFKP